ncbi:N-6 DNA methylase [Alicyclobacillus curvatus]|nr:N-6 DNA methylase [Alicyclobacillus curvatus]
MLDVKDLQKTHGAVFTNPEVVDLILDLAGYTTDKLLDSCRLLDPSVGDGAFLIQAVSRLLSSYRERTGSLDGCEEALKDCIRGIEVNPESLVACRDNLAFVLTEYGLSKDTQNALLDAWLVCDDFLLWNCDLLSRDTSDSHGFDFVVGNPPYVRQELVPDAKMTVYRSMYSTIYDRADLYVPFIQHSLELLNPDGMLSFICADRFMRNRYGKRLREYIVTKYQLRCVIDVHKTSPFADDVSAYPAIFVISNTDAQSPVHVLSMETVDSESCARAKDILLGGHQESAVEGIESHRFDTWVTGDSPWILESADHHVVLRKLEAEHPLIEDELHGIKVGIGVATGADRVYIVNPDKQGLDIESDVLLPIVTTKDIASGEIRWSGKYVVNPFESDGSLINLDKYPKLKRYFDSHGEVIKGRNVAKKSSAKWYRTIDRIYPELVGKPKLLIPDVKADNHIVKDLGQYYPHHNLYYVLPGVWDIDALRAVLLSSVVRFFIWSYAVKMRGDFLRYQAQYLRRIHLPAPDAITADTLGALRTAASAGDRESLDHIVAEIYGLTDADMKVIQKSII